MKKLLWTAAATGALVAGASLAGRALLRNYRWFDWSGKRVIVTGGSRGLGLCLARKLLDAGAFVAIVARTQADLDSAAQQLHKRCLNPNRVWTFSCDVRERSSCEAMVHGVFNRFGGVDVLINNAGIIEVGPSIR